MPSHTAGCGQNEPYEPFKPFFGASRTEEILRKLGFSEYLQRAPLRLAIICDDATQVSTATMPMIEAGERYQALKPALVMPRVIEQRFFHVDEIRGLADTEDFETEEICAMAGVENSKGSVIGLSLLVLFCKAEPTDLVLGIGEEGQALVSELKRNAVKMYPDRANRFVTQAELEREAVTRNFGSEPNAFMLVAFEHLYGAKIADHSFTA